MQDISEEEQEEEQEKEQQEEVPVLTIHKRKSERAKKRPDCYRDYIMLTYAETITGPDRENWIRAIKKETRSLEENETWEIVDTKQAVPQKPLKSKWIQG